MNNMILKITFGDNDFTQVIEEFLDKVYVDRGGAIQYIIDKYKEADRDLYYKKINELMEFTFYLNQKWSEDITKEDMLKYIEYLKDNLGYYFEQHENENKDYLMKHLKITPVKTVASKWQNGEVLYWFTSYRKYITM